jgi:hypothetical protein
MTSALARALPSCAGMTLKIEATLHLIGRIGAENMGELLALVRRLRPHVVLDLDEVMLVDVSVVRFLTACEADGIELRHCAPYIREWMDREGEDWS